MDKLFETNVSVTESLNNNGHFNTRFTIDNVKQVAVGSLLHNIFNLWAVD